MGQALGKFGSTLTHSASGHILLCARKEEKMLPGTVVKEMLAEKVEAIEFEQGRALKKKEKEALKEEILHTLLPRAFSRTSQTFAWINPADNLMVVDAGSAKKADDLLALLRKSIGSLPVVPVALKNPPEITMTEWLNEGNLPASFTLEDEAELRSAMEHGGIIRCKQQDLMSDEIKNHLANDKLVTKLALNWGETVSFVLGDDLSIKRLKFSEELREQKRRRDQRRSGRPSGCRFRAGHRRAEPVYSGAVCRPGWRRAVHLSGLSSVWPLPSHRKKTAFGRFFYIYYG